MTYFGEEGSSLIHYDKSDTKRLQEITLKVYKEQPLIFSYFSSHPHSQWILRENTKWSFLITPLMRSHYLMCLQMFPNPKILNPKVLSWFMKFLSLEALLKNIINNKP